MQVLDPEAKVEAGASCLKSAIRISTPNILDLLSSRSIYESISRMKDAQIIYILHISLLEIQSNTKSLCKKMQRIKSFSLCFSDRRDICTSRQM